MACFVLSEKKKKKKIFLGHRQVFILAISDRLIQLPLLSMSCLLVEFR